MSLGSFTMWGTLIVMGLGLAMTIVFDGNPINAIRDAYPSDVGKREALRRCARMVASFTRFSSSDRDTCYRTTYTASAQNWSNNPTAW
jgi:hypothetical protein